MDTATVLGLAQDLGVLLLFAVGPWIDIPVTRRLRANPSGAARLTLYRRICIGLWLSLAYVVLAAGGPARIYRVPLAPGEWTWLGHPLGVGLAALLCGAFFLAAVWPAVHGLRGGAARRARYAKSMQSLAYFLPASPHERRWWALVSLSAGVCEEFVMRGFLIQYFRGALEGPLHLGLTSAVLLSTLAFGLGHAYQGASGIVRTALAGGVLALLTVLTGNLLLPIVVHALIDLSALGVYRPDEDAALARRAAVQAT